MTKRRILVPTDFSKTSNKALGVAVDLAAAQSAEIVLLHVAQPVLVGASPEIYGASAMVLKLIAEQEADAKRRLQRMGLSVRRKTGAPVRVLVRSGSAHEVIVAVADRLAADLIVIGTQGRSGLSHLLLGSVAERVVRLARCPVLTVSARARVRSRKRGKRR